MLVTVCRRARDKGLRRFVQRKNVGSPPTLLMIGHLLALEDDAIIVEVLGRHRRLVLPDRVGAFVRRAAVPGDRVLVRAGGGVVVSFLPCPEPIE